MQLKVLCRRSKLLKLTWDGQVFHELDQSVDTFAPDFDWIVWKNVGGTMHVLDSKAFHAEFRDLAALREAVVENVTAIRASVEIENADELIERCRQMVPMASKLKHAVEHGIVGSPISVLKQYAQQRQIDVQWHGDALVYENTIEKQWNILKLLDEDRTERPVSGRTYESSAKRQVS